LALLFYAWSRRPESRRSRENGRLKKQIDAIYAESDGVYGSRKVRDELLTLGFRAGKHRVARLMQEMGLQGCPKKRYKVTTRSDHRFRVAPPRSLVHGRATQSTLGGRHHLYPNG